MVARYPDFEHKKTQERLWLDEQQKPPWVEAVMAALPPGTLQLNIFGWDKMLWKYVKVGQPEKALQLFQLLQQQEGMSPDNFTSIHVLNACASL
jgi:pentatricopeptide repeat protein